MISVLVTGGNGQLGTSLQELSNFYAEIKFVFKDVDELDITSNESLEKCFKDHEFDYLINCAAYTAVDKAEEEKEKAYLINAEAVKNLCEICKSSGVTMIHISTDFIFDGSNTAPYHEKDVADPINVYGASKLKGENYIVDSLSKYFIIRTSWVYSQYGNNFVKTMLRLGKSKQEISVVSDQIGCPTSAIDLANVIIRLITSKSQKFGIYHYSGFGETNWFEFATKIFEEKGVNIKVNPIKTEEYPTLARRPKYSVLNTSKIKEVLEIDIPSWKDSLKHILEELNE